jgi:tellurite resistance protein
MRVLYSCRPLPVVRQSGCSASPLAIDCGVKRLIGAPRFADGVYAGRSGASTLPPFFLAAAAPHSYLRSNETKGAAMALPTAHEALIYLMVVTSASDRDMTDVELARIGNVVRSWPIFEGFDDEKLIGIAQDCQKRLHENGGMTGVLTLARKAIPEHLHDTAYAMAFEVATVDLEMRMEEVRVLQLLRQHLNVDDATIAAIERTTKARHRTLT